jgi:stage V sporulation protein B
MYIYFIAAVRFSTGGRYVLTKDSLIRGTIILVAAAFVARFLGLVQKIPLQHILGDDGLATYGIAYSVYGMLLIVATAGIPSALSKMISERYAMGQLADARRIYQAAIWFAIAGGVISSLLLYICAPYYAVHIAKDPNADLAIKAIAPALLIFPLIAIMRGYFQGRQMMKAGGLSQIFEQIIRVSTAVGIAYLFLWWGYADKTIAAGASFGAVTGAAAAMLVMLYFQKYKRRTDRMEGLTAPVSGDNHTLRYRQIYRNMLRLSLPISIISLTVPVIYFIDNSTVIDLLEENLGALGAKEQLGILTGKAQSLAGIPPILAIALSMSVVPVISAAFAKKDVADLVEKSSLALRISIITGLPVVIVLSVAAEAIIGFLFKDAVGWETASLLTISALFQIVMMTSAAILMGLGQTTMPMLYVVFGVAAKFLGNMWLAPSLGMIGILLATMVCFVIIMILNLWSLRRKVAYRVLGHRWPGFLLTGTAITAVGVGMVYLFNGPLAINGRIGYGVEAAAIGIVLLVLYPLCLILFRAVTSEDVRRFPKPLQKLLKPFDRLLGER